MPVFQVEISHQVQLKKNASQCLLQWANLLSQYPVTYKTLDKSPHSIHIIVVNAKYIQTLNHEFRQIDKPTDVLTFEIDSSLGEIYICPEFIRQYNSRYEDNICIEMLRLIIHGWLHLCGLDHSGYFDQDNYNEEMFVIQEDILFAIIDKQP